MSAEEIEKKLPAAILATDKKGAAQRQLESAIMLWFQTEEPVSIHTLAVTANDCYRAMGKKAGKPSSMVQDWMNTLPAKQNEVIRHTQNFFKHGLKDLEETAVFTPLHAELMILESANYHELLFGKLTPLMLCFAIRFVAENPRIVTGGQQAVIRQIIDAYPLEGVKIDDLLKLNRQDFLATLGPKLHGIAGDGGHTQSREPKNGY